MRKKVYGFQLSRTSNQRTALFRSLISSLIEKGAIETSLAKAKAIKPELEKLITKAKSSSVANRRAVSRFLNKKFLVNRLFDVIAPVFKERNGGYLRLVRVERRKGDNSQVVRLMFTEELPIEPEGQVRPGEKKSPVGAIEKSSKKNKEKRDGKSD